MRQRRAGKKRFTKEFVSPQDELISTGLDATWQLAKSVWNNCLPSSADVKYKAKKDGYSTGEKVGAEASALYQSRKKPAGSIGVTERTGDETSTAINMASSGWGKFSATIKGHVVDNYRGTDRVFTHYKAPSHPSQRGIVEDRKAEGYLQKGHAFWGQAATGAGGFVKSTAATAETAIRTFTIPNKVEYNLFMAFSRAALTGRLPIALAGREGSSVGGAARSAVLCLTGGSEEPIAVKLASLACAAVTGYVFFQFTGPIRHMTEATAVAVGTVGSIAGTALEMLAFQSTGGTVLKAGELAAQLTRFLPQYIMSVQAGKLELNTSIPKDRVEAAKALEHFLSKYMVEGLGDTIVNNKGLGTYATVGFYAYLNNCLVALAEQVFRRVAETREVSEAGPDGRERKVTKKGPIDKAIDFLEGTDEIEPVSQRISMSFARLSEWFSSLNQPQPQAVPLQNLGGGPVAAPAPVAQQAAPAPVAQQAAPAPVAQQAAPAPVGDAEEEPQQAAPAPVGEEEPLLLAPVGPYEGQQPAAIAEEEPRGRELEDSKEAITPEPTTGRIDSPSGTGSPFGTLGVGFLAPPPRGRQSDVSPPTSPSLGEDNSDQEGIRNNFN